jgi:signal transduction histidine kinase
LISADTEMHSVARTLAEIAQILAVADGADARVQAALGLVHRIVPNTCCALLEVVPKHGRCELFTHPPQLPPPRAALRSRLAALLQMLSEDDDAPGGEPAAPDEEAAPSAHPHLALPVVGLNQIIGVLFVEQPGEPYDEHSLRLLSVLAAQLGAYLTTVRLREEELEHARQLGIALQKLQETDRRKDEFLAMLGHELRNPIGAINNVLRIIDHRGPEVVPRYQQVIDRQIRHLSRIVDDLLDASRVRLGKITLERQPLDLKVIAERWMEAFGTTGAVQSHDIELVAPAPVCIDGDVVRLEQVFSNLLTNALKYTLVGGKIRITVASEDGHGVIRVRDSGIGMTPSVLATAFELFTQADESLARSQGGLGLGLPLVRSLVEKHGGVVAAFSDGPGLGSEFVVRLPLATASGATVAVPPPITLAPPGSLRILLIEDNEDARETLHEMLSIWGHRTEQAADGLAGVTQALADSFDVLLVDIGLPKLDGYEVARRVRRTLGERTPLLVAMTGYGQPDDRRRAADAGFDAHMVKPINAFELQQRLATVRPPLAGTG